MGGDEKKIFSTLKNQEMHIMLRDLFTLILLYKKPVTAFENPRAE
jgi:hypothetical protein